MHTFSRIERLRCDLQQPCGLLNIIIPSTEKVQHDHTYSIDQGKGRSTLSPPAYDSAVVCVHVEKTTEDDILAALHVTAEERQAIENDTRKQSSSSHWYDVRRRQITGSKCGRIIMQKE